MGLNGYNFNSILQNASGRLLIEDKNQRYIELINLDHLFLAKNLVTIL
jgi:hypothetical protein